MTALTIGYVLLWAALAAFAATLAAERSGRLLLAASLVLGAWLAFLACCFLRGWYFLAAPDVVIVGASSWLWGSVWRSRQDIRRSRRGVS